MRNLSENPPQRQRTNYEKLKSRLLRVVRAGLFAVMLAPLSETLAQGPSPSEREPSPPIVSYWEGNKEIIIVMEHNQLTLGTFCPGQADNGFATVVWRRRLNPGERAALTIVNEETRNTMIRTATSRNPSETTYFYDELDLLLGKYMFSFGSEPRGSEPIYNIERLFSCPPSPWTENGSSENHFDNGDSEQIEKDSFDEPYEQTIVLLPKVA